MWQEAMTLVEEIYIQSRRFPPDERFGLTSQLRRAAVSVPSNIGEGARRKRPKVNLHHLNIALGSQGELEVSDRNRVSSWLLRAGRIRTNSGTCLQGRSHVEWIDCVCEAESRRIAVVNHLPPTTNQICHNST